MKDELLKDFDPLNHEEIKCYFCEALKDTDLSDVECVLVIPFLHQGWEGDYWGFIVKNQAGELLLLKSGHGRYCVSKSDLSEEVALYQMSLARTRLAQRLLNRQTQPIPPKDGDLLEVAESTVNCI